MSEKQKTSNPNVKIVKGLGIPQQLWDQIDQLASKEAMSRNAYLEHVIREHLRKNLKE
jgi:hypothetical protein